MRAVSSVATLLAEPCIPMRSLCADEVHDTDGNLSQKKLDRVIELKPLQTIEFLIERTDVTGGSGTNFIVEWRAGNRSVHRPLIEAVMVGRSGTNAISFVRKSEPLPEWDPER
jgi:hypothetical protein